MQVTADFQTLVELLSRRAQEEPHRVAFRFLHERDSAGVAEITCAALEEKARAIAAHLQAMGAGPGERVLLLFPPGLDFIAALFGALYAGAAAVPAYPPHPARLRSTLPMLETILASGKPAVVLSAGAIEAAARTLPLREGLRWLVADDVPPTAAADWTPPRIDGQNVALLQYTSGSTSSPKGVLLTHRNLLCNSAAIQRAFHHSPESRGVIWLPPYHDMGLIGGIIQPLFAGFPVTLMSPASFLMRPMRWLETVSRERATTSGGPNFAFDVCVRKTTPEQRAKLDLSNWKVAFVGAEPVRRETLERFAAAFAPSGFLPEAFFPCYGLAESTLFVSGGRLSGPPRGRAPSFVACGEPAPGVEVRIVEPESCVPCPEGDTGEVWLRSESSAHGYFGLPEETERTFHARLGNTAGDFLRTGDLGFLDAGELFLSGRLKDLIIIGGRNHCAEDIEQTVAGAHPALREGHCAAFSVEIEGEERLVVAAEVARRPGGAPDAEAAVSAPDEVRESIRRAVAGRHDLRAEAVLLLPQATLPRTTSGKVQRHLCRAGYLAGAWNALIKS